ncbi:TonB-dependent receptor [Sphingomonas sp. Root710]|uniref:TonB-dependent receptor n=1 Tax=Sphingomonas sp. Root710 TaxID=1736594 RepID=UPI00138F0D6B|nr:TonB-dependent receptor [Sphingomonas sp. Root710]
MTASALALSGTAAVAQESSNDGGSLMGDIVVTAQKKSAGEKAQDVPIAITALGESQLRTLNVRSLEDLNAIAPNASLDTNSTFRGYANFSFRGVGLGSSVPSLEPAVGLFIDGVYQGVNAGAVSDNFDLGTIQMLRGPQGTLFGRNVTGGAVLVETARPTGEFGGYVQASYETGPEYSAQGAVNVPIAPGLLNARLAGYYRNDKGWFTNQFNNKPFGKLRTIMARPSFELTTGALKQTLILEYGDVNGDGGIIQAFNEPKGSFKIALDQPGFTKRRWYSATSESVIDVGFGDGAITNVFGYRDFREHAYTDLDGSILPLTHLAALTDQYQLSNELRYAGKFGPAEVTVGLYYLHQKLDYREARVPFIAGNRGGGGVQKSDSYGAFAQADITLTDKLSAIAGLRYSYEEKAAKIVPLTVGRCLDVTQPCDFSNNPLINKKLDWHSLSPKLGLNYKANSDVLLYASFGKSTRSGGFNVRISNPADPGIFDQETMTAYEVGMKADLIGRTLRANIAAFTNDYKNLQRTTSFYVGALGTQIIDNSADARLQGIEVDLTASPTPGLEFIAGVGYLDAHYTKVTGDLNADKVVDKKDRALKLVRAPNWTFSVGGIYNMEFDSGAALKTQVFFAHRAKSAALDDNSVFFPDYNDLRGNISFTLPNKATSISVYGRNLTNEAHNTSGTAKIPFPSGGIRAIGEGRSWGVEVRQSF